MRVKNTLWDQAKIGWYVPIKEKGKIKWDVKTSESGGFLCERQEDAAIMSMLLRIMERMKIKDDIDFFTTKNRKT